VCHRKKKLKESQEDAKNKEKVNKLRETWEQDKYKNDNKKEGYDESLQ
jgi:hypothetical protein